MEADINIISFGSVNQVVYYSIIQEVNKPMKTLKSGKAACLGEVTGEMIKNEDDRMIVEIV